MAIKSLAVSFGLGAAAVAGLVIAGPLNPPAGPVASTYKTLSEVEPRTAINAANTPGDATSVFKITQPGSYYLTGNITGVSGKDGIQINVSGVSLDLNGFELLGVSGSLNGVNIVAGAALTNIAVLNGSVRNWGGAGVTTLFGGSDFRVSGILASGNLGSGIKLGELLSASPNNVACTVTHCTAANNSGDVAISVGNGSTVSNCSVSTNNTANGIFARDGSTVSSCSVFFNQGLGISTATACTLSDCSVLSSANGGSGIFAGAGSTLSNCSSSNNQAHGIATGSSCTLINCTANANTLNGFNILNDCALSNCVANGNTGSGINAPNGCVIQECLADNNSANGITAALGCTIRNCHVRANPQNGIQSGSGGQIIDNLLDGNGLAAGTQSNILLTGDSARVEGNSILGGDRGIATNGGGNVIVRNSIRGGTNPYGGIAAGNDVGPVGSAATATSPWANIQY